MNLTAEPLFRRGLELIDRRQFFEAHEVLEELWLESSGEERLFLQSLIHFAVGYYHAEEGNAEGARLQLAKAVRKIAGYLPAFAGIDTAGLYEAGVRSLEAAGGALPGLPKLGAGRGSS
jgi:uncharacterized protein